ncbi:MAG: ABC transporter permease, partial [Chitinophagaceae bacterium]|nr:ABC transporter permease [Chitinophagaceae bacterium]
MLKNYLRTAWRNLSKSKFYTSINILGLTTGLAVGVLILLWVQDELSFDKFHHNMREIYRVNATIGTGTSKQTGEYTPGPIAVTALTQIPGIKSAVRISGNYDYSV